LADDLRGCDQVQVRLYVVGVTEPAPEPTNADLMATLIEQSEALAALTELMQQGFAHAMTEIAGVKDEVQRSEASLTARVADVQNVVRTLKADLSAHAADPGAHHRHAA
jgi:hypothetical protein